MKSKINVILVGLLIFLLGGVAGGISHYLFRQYHPPKALNFIEIMAKELKLDPDQKEQVRKIINETRGRVKALNLQFMPQWESINKEYMPLWETLRKDSDQKIKNILRDDQKALFENFLKKRLKPPQMKNAPSTEKK
jgi:hypothetical protein